MLQMDRCRIHLCTAFRATNSKRLLAMPPHPIPYLILRPISYQRSTSKVIVKRLTYAEKMVQCRLAFPI